MSVVIDGSNGVDIGAGNLTFPNNTTQTTTGQPTLMTAVASTSGTSVNFTGIPSWVKQITVMFSGVSTNGASSLQVQIGSGSIATTGYVSTNIAASGATVGQGSSTAGFILINATAGSAANVASGSMIITNLSGNTWVEQFSMSFGTTLGTTGGGTVTLSGTLDQLRIIGSNTGSPVDTFDAGSINVMYE